MGSLLPIFSTGPIFLIPQPAFPVGLRYRGVPEEAADPYIPNLDGGDHTYPEDGPSRPGGGKRLIT